MLHSGSVKKGKVWLMKTKGQDITPRDNGGRSFKRQAVNVRHVPITPTGEKKGIRRRNIGPLENTEPPNYHSADLESMGAPKGKGDAFRHLSVRKREPSEGFRPMLRSD